MNSTPMTKLGYGTGESQSYDICNNWFSFSYHLVVKNGIYKMGDKTAESEIINFLFHYQLETWSIHNEWQIT